MESYSTPPPIPKQRRRIKFPFLLVGILLLPLLSYAAYRLVLRSQVQRELTMIKREGFSITLKELDDSYVATNGNGATFLTNAFAQLVPGDTNGIIPYIGKIKLTRTNSFTDEMIRSSTTFLQSNAPAFGLLEKGVSVPTSRFPIDLKPGPAALLPHLAKVKKSAAILQLRTALAAETNNPEEAIESILLLGALNRSLEKEPVLISFLVRMALQSMDCMAVEQALNRTRFSEAQLMRLQDAFHSLPDTNALHYSLCAERAFGIDVFENHLSILGGSLEGEPEPRKFGERLTIHGYRLSGLADRDLLVYLKLTRQLIEASKLGYPNRPDEFLGREQLIEQTEKGLFIVSRMLLPSLGKLGDRDATVLAQIRVTEAALAIERFRLKKQTLPKNLEELVPDFVTSIPRDPFDGERVRYKKLSRGYIVYSVGSDREDNEGKERNSKRVDDEYDVTVIVEH